MSRWHIAIAWYTLTPFKCFCQDPICVALHWTVALEVMELMKVVMVDAKKFWDAYHMEDGMR